MASDVALEITRSYTRDEGRVRSGVVDFRDHAVFDDKRGMALAEDPLSESRGKPRAPSEQVSSSEKSSNEKSTFLRETYERYAGSLMRYILKTFGEGPPEPEDVAHTAFTKFACLESPQTIENPQAFLYATARNFVLDHKRRAKIIHAYHSEQVSLESMQTDDVSPEHISLVRELIGIVSKTIGGMSARRRDILLLSRIEGLNYCEIGRRTGMTETGVRKHIKKALVDCMAALEKADVQIDMESGDRNDRKGGE